MHFSIIAVWTINGENNSPVAKWLRSGCMEQKVTSSDLTIDIHFFLLKFSCRMSDHNCTSHLYHNKTSNPQS